tara:strand:- start:1037 stop:1255 length:219 start_codon:yes stop_codon:yes gene_type:complete
MNYFTILSLFACIFSFFSVGLSLYACILAKSLEKATHTVQFMPVDEDFSNKKDMDEMNVEQKEDNEDFYRMV